MITMKNVDPEMIANNLTPAIPTHPGEILKEEIEFRGISQRQLAEQMGVQYSVLNEILNKRRPLTEKTALLFEAALGIDAEPPGQPGIHPLRKGRCICVQPQQPFFKSGQSSLIRLPQRLVKNKGKP